MFFLILSMQVKSLCLYTKLYKKQRLFYLHASICALVFIDGEAGEHVNMTSQYYIIS